MKELTKFSKAGDIVKWKTMDGRIHSGTMKEWDSNVAIVEENGRETAVEC